MVLVVWFLPSVLKQMLAGQAGNAVYRSTCIFIWITAVPCLLCLVKFWGVCSRIGENRSLQENAEALKQMSHYTLVDSVLYALFWQYSVYWGGTPLESDIYSALF